MLAGGPRRLAAGSALQGNAESWRRHTGFTLKVDVQGNYVAAHTAHVIGNVEAANAAAIAAAKAAAAAVVAATAAVADAVSPAPKRNTMTRRAKGKRRGGKR